MKLCTVIAIGLVAFALPRAAEAQSRGNTSDIPASSRPPAGMCRIWLDGVPAAQQPAPTDCASAVRNRPAKGRVIFGDDYVKTKSKSKSEDTSTKAKPPIKGFAPSTSRSTKKPPIVIP